MQLPDLWFVAIALLWAGYFFLEGFDFGVGMLLPVLGRTEHERRALISTIGPVWDGNEVWLIVAVGATFASFPLWYAALFSGFYLPLLVILVALILRGVAFEYRGKIDGQRWRGNWDRAIFFGSLVPAALWGVMFGNVLRGVPINADFDYAGGLGDLLNVYSLVGGLTTLTLMSATSQPCGRLGPVAAGG
jgi:cytochrome d ubiquinol oxidase subunit II